MKKLPILCLLAAAILLSSCGADEMGDATSAPNGTENAVTTTTAESAGTTAAGTTANEEGDKSEPEAPVADEAFADLVKEFPIVSEPTGDFVTENSSVMIDDAVKRAESMKDSVLQFKVSQFRDMGGLGSDEERFTVTIKKIGEDYQNITETTVVSDGKTSKIVSSDTYVNGMYYYSGPVIGSESILKCKVPMSKAQFEQYVLGESADREAEKTIELGNLVELVDQAALRMAGMTEEGGCNYYAIGVSEEVLKKLDLLDMIGDQFGFAMTDDGLADIAIVVMLDKEGDLSRICIDLPLEYSVEEGDLSMTVTIPVELEITLRAAAADDKVKAPADANSYTKKTVEAFFHVDDRPDDKTTVSGEAN